MATPSERFRSAVVGIPLSQAKRPDNGEVVGAFEQLESEVTTRLDLVETSALIGVKPQSEAVRVLITANTAYAAITAGSTQDGVVVAAGDRVARAYNGQTGDALNGVLVVQASGAALRATDLDSSDELIKARFSVTAGSHAGEAWAVQNIAAITLGTTPIVITMADPANAQSAEIIASRDAEANLLARVTRDRDMVEKGLGALTVIGLTATPSAFAGNAGPGTFALDIPAPFDCVISKVEIYNNTAGRTVVIGTSRKAGSVFTEINATAALPLTAGQNNVFKPGLSFAKGDRLEFTGSASGWAAFETVAAGASLTPYHLGTLSGGTFTNTGAPTTNLQLQIRVTLSVPNAVKALADESAGRVKALAGSSAGQIIGQAGDLTAGALSAGIGSFVFEQCVEDSHLPVLEIWPSVSSALTVSAFTRHNGVTTNLRDIVTINVKRGEWNRIPVNADFLAGEWPGLTGAIAGWASFDTVAAGLSQTPYYGGAVTVQGASFTQLTRTTTFSLKLRMQLVTKGRPRQISLHKSAKIALLGQSIEIGSYNPRRKNWPNKLSEETDYQFELYSQGGAPVATLLATAKNANNAAFGRNLQQMRPDAIWILMGKNDDLAPTALATFLSDLREFTQFMQSMGSQVVIFSEMDQIYGAFGNVAFRKVAEDLGCLFIDRYELRKKHFNAADYYSGFFQGTPFTALGWHPNARANDGQRNAARKALALMPPAGPGVKIFRKRDSVTVADINTDLMFVTQYERNQRFKEISLGGIHFAADKVGYLDTLNPSSAYNGTFVTETSERLALSGGGTIALGTHALLEYRLGASISNIHHVTALFSDPALDVYVLDNRTTPRAWTRIQLSSGLLRLGNLDLQGRLRGRDGDILPLLLAKAGGISITEPIFRITEDGPPRQRLVLPKPVAKGAELATVKKVATAGAISSGWAAGGGTAIVTAPAFKLPPNSTGIFELSPTKTMTLTPSFTVDNDKDREIVISAKAGRFPPIHTDTGNLSPPITEDTFDDRLLYVTLIDGGGQEFRFEAVVDCWWDTVEVRAFIPLEVAAFTIRFSADDVNVYIDEASVQLVEA